MYARRTTRCKVAKHPMTTSTTSRHWYWRAAHLAWPSRSMWRRARHEIWVPTAGEIEAIHLSSASLRSMLMGMRVWVGMRGVRM